MILLVLGGFVYFAAQRGSEPTERDERPFIYKVNPDAIVGIKVEYQDHEVGFVLTEEGWVCDDAEDTPVDTQRFGGMAYLLSGPKADRTQRFIHRQDDPQVFMVHSSWTDVLTRLATEPPYPPPVLLYATAQEDIVSINVTYRRQEVRLARTEEGWVFDDPSGAPADQERLASLLPLLAELKAKRSMENVTDMATYGLAQPQGTVTIVDKDGLSLVLELGGLSPGGTEQYARVPDGTDVLVMDIALTQALTRLATEPPHATPEPVAP